MNNRKGDNMNKTLIIYDSNGVVLQQRGGLYELPNGVPYIEVEIPSGKRVVSVDVVTNQPIYEDIPLTWEENTDNKISILEQENANINYTLMMGGLI